MLTSLDQHAGGTKQKTVKGKKGPTASKSSKGKFSLVDPLNYYFSCLSNLEDELTLAVSRESQRSVGFLEDLMPVVFGGISTCNLHLRDIKMSSARKWSMGLTRWLLEHSEN